MAGLAAGPILPNVGRYTRSGGPLECGSLLPLSNTASCDCNGFRTRFEKRRQAVALQRATRRGTTPLFQGPEDFNLFKAPVESVLPLFNLALRQGLLEFLRACVRNRGAHETQSTRSSPSTSRSAVKRYQRGFRAGS